MKFRFYREATGVEGWQAFIVEADSLEEAKVLCDGTETVFDFEDVGVSNLGEADGFEQIEDDYTPEGEREEAERLLKCEEEKGLRLALERAVVMGERTGECPIGYHMSNEQGSWEPEETCEVLSESDKCDSLTCWKKYLTRKE